MMLHLKRVEVTVLQPAILVLAYSGGVHLQEKTSMSCYIKVVQIVKKERRTSTTAIDSRKTIAFFKAQFRQSLNHFPHCCQYVFKNKPRTNETRKKQNKPKTGQFCCMAKSSQPSVII